MTRTGEQNTPHYCMHALYIHGVNSFLSSSPQIGQQPSKPCSHCSIATASPLSCGSACPDWRLPPHWPAALNTRSPLVRHRGWHLSNLLPTPPARPSSVNAEQDSVSRLRLYIPGSDEFSRCGSGEGLVAANNQCYLAWPEANISHYWGHKGLELSDRNAGYISCV